jgi:hypothetical protein
MNHNHSFHILIILTITLILFSTFAIARPIYVNIKSSGTNDGSSWENAYINLQAALSQADGSTYTQIWVSKGIYHPGTEKSDAFLLTNNVALYGGFTGVENNLNQRNWAQNITILSGDLENDDIVGSDGYVENARQNGKTNLIGKNAFSVVTANKTDHTAILDGFYISAGKTNGRGGGISCCESTPKLQNLYIVGNWAGSGGGIFCERNIHITDVVISGNYSASHGGGIYFDQDSPCIENATVFGNNAACNGGGIYSNFGNPIIINSTIFNNSASEGGGISFFWSKPDLQNVSIFNNIASNIGGGLYCYHLKTEKLFSSIEKCSVFENFAGYANDIYSSKSIEVELDTFSVAQPTVFNAAPINNFTFSIEQAKHDQIVSDLYVSTQGDDTNSGTSIDKPFKSINHALSVIIADSANPRKIFLDSGTYSPETGSVFPISLIDYVSIIGQGHNQTILDANFSNRVLHANSVQGVYLKDLKIINGTAQKVSNGYSDDGGGIFCEGSNLNISNVTITNNLSGRNGGGIYSSESSFTLSNVSIFENSSGSGGGGIYLHYNDHLNFDDINKCSIYDNFSGFGNDLVSYNEIDVVLDFFSVIDPTEFHAVPINKFNFQIQRGKNIQVQSDLFVSPSGNDANDGLSQTKPFKSINHALSVIQTDNSNPLSIYLDEGVYNYESGTVFPISIISHVNIQGRGKEKTILDANYLNRVISCKSVENSRINDLQIRKGASSDGAGIYFDQANIALNNLMILDNHASFDGGGMYCGYDTNITLSTIPEQITFEDTPIYSIPLTITCTETTACDLSLFFETSASALIPPENISYTCISDTLYISLTPTTDQSGTAMINLTANDAENNSRTTSFALEVIPVNDPPIIVDISDQTIPKGSFFTPIVLDDFIADIDNSLTEIAWTATGQNDLTITIKNRIATIEQQHEEWTGTETINFIATDPDGMSSTGIVVFTVIPIIPEIERQALIDLYNSTGGDNWKNNTGWLGEVGTECNWFGVTCDNESFHVIKLRFYNNDLTNTPIIGNLNSLTSLHLHYNKLTSVPSEIGKLTNLTSLYLQCNNLKSVPPEIGNLNNLTCLDLRSNDLSSVPPEIGNLSNLTCLSFSSNAMTSLPPEIGNLTHLTHFYLDSNALTSLPPEIGNLIHLTTFSLYSNNLTSVPLEINKLTNLTSLGLFYNELTSLPKEIGSMTNLNILNLNGNKLSSLPSEIIHLQSTVSVNYNAIDISDDEIIQFLDSKQSNWRETQTVSPKNLTITTITNNSITLTWSIIDYKSHKGGYEIFYSQSSNESYTFSTITADKLIEHTTLNGLFSNTTYYFKVRSVTYPHYSGPWGSNNSNTVKSNFTNEISAKTKALIAMPKQSLSGVMNYSSISIDITGSGADFYIYKLNQNDWSEEFPLNIPITLNSLEDGPYTLHVKGKNNDGSVQDSPSIYTWHIDTNAEPPNLNLPTQWDTGTLNNDQITNATQLTLTGTCEKEATIQFYDNIQPINYQNITFDNNTFTATFTLTKGTHTITAIQTDPAGNRSQPSKASKIHIDTQVDNFSINDLINDSPCLWALELQNITLSGTRESQSTISVGTSVTNTINISYPDDHTWKAQVINMPTGSYTLLIQIVDIAGNMNSIEKRIDLFEPETAIIDTQTNNLLADNTQTLSMIFSFFTTEHTPICVVPTVQISTTMGEIINESQSISNNQLICLLKADSYIGTARISASFKNKELGSKTIEMVPGPYNQMAFHCSTPIQEVDLSENYITLQLMDAYGHPVFIDNEMTIKVSSTAKSYGHFYTQKGDFWDWDDGQVIFTFKPDINTFKFMYKASVPGNFDIQASNEQNEIIASLSMNIVDHPLAILSNPPPTYTSDTNFQFSLEGAITDYQFQLDSNAWQAEKTVDTPITFSNLNDGLHTLKIIGKNMLGNWQNKSIATTVQWTVDTLNPTITYLSNDTSLKKSKTWNWSANENCSFRFTMDQNPSWSPSSEFSSITTATKDSGDGKWYLHVQAKDLAGNTSEVKTVFAMIDNTPPIFNDLTNDSTPRQSKTWHFNTNESCKIRYFIDQNVSWVPTGDFVNTTDATINSGDGTWYLHIQAKDEAGNLTNKTVYATLDNTPPGINGLSDDSNHRKNKTWIWSASESCTFRYSIDQNATWEPLGSFNNTKTATKNSGDGKWYLHVQAKDQAGNLSNVKTVYAMLDNSMPGIDNLSNDSTPRQSKTWDWSTSENSTYRFAIDQNPTWQPSGAFNTQSTATKSNADGKWYLHVQAKDDAGNLSDVVTVFAILDNTDPIIHDLVNDTSPRQNKTWNWTANENCTFRFVTNQNSSWEPTGSFGNTNEATINSGDGTWYLHIQAKDEAGNLTNKTVYVTLDNTPPGINGLSDDSNHRKNKTWIWSASESCTFRYSIDQNATWEPLGSFNNTKTATKNSGDGKWYLHVQAKDQAGNLSNVKTVYAMLDNSMPGIDNLSNDSTPRQSKTWDWSTSENSTYRFAIDQNPTWQPSGAFNTQSTATKSNADGKWYLHVQAKDDAGNLSDVVTVFAILDNTDPIIHDLVNDTSPRQNKTWNWSANENCTFRFSIDQHSSWQATGDFANTTEATINSGDGTWYLHVQAKDEAGNLTSKTVYTILDNTRPTINGLSDDSNHRKNKTWHWSSNETCTFRYAIDQNAIWQPTGSFTNSTSAAKNTGDGKWYLHVQAKDSAGNLSHMTTVFVMLDNTNPVMNPLSNDSTSRQSITWNWSTNENCTYRFAIDQNPSWEPTGEFGTKTTATKNSVDGKWYLHVQAKDDAGNLSELISVYAILDNTKPIIYHLADDASPKQTQTWQWAASESCTYRFIIDQNTSWEPSGIFDSITSATKNSGDGQWYLHVQAKDEAGNLSDIQTVFAIFDNIPPKFSDLLDDASHRQSKTWHLNTNEPCQFRHSIDQNPTWTAIGEFVNKTNVAINSGDGKWYLHIQAKDEAGNLTSKTVFTVLDNTRPEINGLSDDPGAGKNKIWNWSANENCTFRFSIDQNPLWEPTGEFNSITTATKTDGNGNWYLHVQAKDLAGNLSLVKTVSTLLDNIQPQITGLFNDPTPTLIKIWNLQANETVTFRFAINQQDSWIASGAFDNYTQAQKSGTMGKWYLHAQAKDLAGNLSETVTVSAEFIPPEIEFKDAYLDCNENDKTVNLALQLSHAIDQDVFVKYKLTDDIQISYPFAILGLDFELPEAPSATIPAGNVEGFIPIQLIDDHFSELKEAIRITLLESNVTLGMNDKHTIILTDNDKSGITIIKSTNIPLVVENQEPQSLTIVLDSQPEYEVTIHLSCDNQDLSIVPSELSFLSDQWNTHQHVYISRQNDDIFKGNDYIDISLNSTSNDNHYNQLTKNIIIQIEDDDPLPVPPPVICPKAPMNNNRINWCWNSGGGTNLFRFKIDNSDLTIDANMSGSFCHEYLFSLSDGLHTFYIQEYNEFIKKWSESSVCHIEIDTGLPCSKPESPVAVTAQNKQFTITYDAADRYIDSSCWNNRSGSGLSEVQLWVAAPNEQSFQLHDTDKNDNIDGVFEYTATKDGTYRFITCAIDKAGNAEHESESIQNEDTQKSETIYTEHFSGYAILAVGAVTDKEGLDSHTLTADNIYKHLINRHFGIEHDLTDPLDHIKYYNPHKNPHTGVDSFELDNVGEPISYKLSFQHAIEEWAFHHISRLSGPLYIILIDHGAKDTFYLSDSSEILTPQDLDGWISKLESKLAEKYIERKEIVIVVGTCYSGSFIPELSASGRIVIASSAHDEPSYRGPKEPGRVREGAFFVSNLFNELAKGKNLADSFIISVQRTEDLTARNVVNRLAPYFDTAAQHPLIDDDADSNGSNNILYTRDGKNSENIYLGFLNQSNDPLSIIATESNPHKILPADQLTVSFKAEVNKPDKVNALWLEIRKPGDRLPQYVEEFRQKELDLEEVNMTYHQGLNQFILNDYPFHDPGKYTIYFYVKDKEGIISGFNETCIYKNRDNNQQPAPVHLISPINLDDPENEDSDETEFTDVILQWENSRDPDFDPFTYAVYLSKNRSFEESATIIKEQLIETICLVKLPDNWDDSDVYWKVISIDDYGAQSESEISRFHTDNPENALSVVFVNVYDRHTNRPIPNVWVQFESNDRKIDLIMNQQGHYIERFHPGVYDINIFGDHYTFQPDRIVIDDQPEISLSFALTSTIQTGDINRNGKQDIGDAIQCLQVISGVDESFYYYDPGALTGDVIELRDAIFILQMLSEVY